MRPLFGIPILILAFSLLSCARHQGENIKLPEDIRRGREIFYDPNAKFFMIQTMGAPGLPVQIVMQILMMLTILMIKSDQGIT